MEVKMRVAFLCCVLLFAGFASASSVEAKSINLPERIPDWILDLIGELPDSIQSIIDQLPDIIETILEAIPEILDRIEEIIELIIDTVPEIIAAIVDQIPQILEQIPELIERLRVVLRTIIARIPELIPVILERIRLVVEAFPQFAEQALEIYDQIKETLESVSLPDWFPTLPDLELPETWPELPELPEFNVPTPGTLTSVEEFPGIVQIEVGIGSIWAQGCAGSVLTSLHVLSSARCVSGRRFETRFRRVRAGASSRYTGGLVVGLETATAHPDYIGEGDFIADIAIIRLATSVLFGSTIQQTAIVPQGFSLPNALTVTLAGWGRTAQGSLISDANLYSVDLIVTDNASCAASWERVPLFTISSDMICLRDPAYNGRTASIRDMGAPIYYQNILVGIFSLGVPDGNSDFPVVAAPIGPYSNWIVSNAV